MSLTHLGKAVQFIAGTRNTTATQIAANAGLSQVVISRACAGTRLEAKSLYALCTSQPDPRDNIDLLIAHLRDEIERAGHSTAEIEVTADTSNIKDDLRLLVEEAKYDPQLRGMLHQLASFLRTHPMQAESLMVAEEQEAYAAGTRPRTDSLRADFPEATPPPAPTPKPAAPGSGKAKKS